jgi:hypothetical protein
MKQSASPRAWRLSILSARSAFQPRWGLRSRVLEPLLVGFALLVQPSLASAQVGALEALASNVTDLSFGGNRSPPLHRHHLDRGDGDRLWPAQRFRPGRLVPAAPRVRAKPPGGLGLRELRAMGHVLRCPHGIHEDQRPPGDQTGTGDTFSGESEAFLAAALLGYAWRIGDFWAFTETAYTIRFFPSVEWKGGVLPSGVPTDLQLSGWSVSAGIQFPIRLAQAESRRGTPCVISRRGPSGACRVEGP